MQKLHPTQLFIAILAAQIPLCTLAATPAAAPTHWLDNITPNCEILPQLQPLYNSMLSYPPKKQPPKALTLPVVSTSWQTPSGVHPAGEVLTPKIAFKSDHATSTLTLPPLTTWKGLHVLSLARYEGINNAMSGFTLTFAEPPSQTFPLIGKYFALTPAHPQRELPDESTATVSLSATPKNESLLFGSVPFGANRLRGT